MTVIRTTMLLLTAASQLWGRTLPVPSIDFPTIQSALDSLQASDTVLVSRGTYHESLRSPALGFVLKGDTLTSPGEDPKPVVDPTFLPRSDTLACLILAQGATPVIEDFIFRNGAAMYAPRTVAGGVRVGGGLTVFRRCVFDSTYEGVFVERDCTVKLQECRFVNAWNSVTGSVYSAVRAIDCYFSGSGVAHVTAGSGTQIERCLFASCTYNFHCNLRGNVLISDCVFRSADADSDVCEASSVYLFRPGGSVIVNNIFEHVRLGTNGVINVRYGCREGDTDSVQICNNRFFDLSIGQLFCSSGRIVIGCSDESVGNCPVRVDSNLFEHIQSGGSVLGRGLEYTTHVSLPTTANQLRDLWWDGTYPGLWPRPVVDAYRTRGSIFRRNRFENTGLAIMTDTVTGRFDTADARWNWWSDSTGPYHELFNPQGHGDTVIGHVNISDWCLDTACTETASTREHSLARPSIFRLSGHPNPFNGTTVIRLEVPQAEIVRVELFDILGRRVRELWAGAIADEKEIAFDGSGLASGVYFVRATNTVWNRPLVSTKIVLLK